jgi:uncharacterized protein (TIGR02145 family)
MGRKIWFYPLTYIGISLMFLVSCKNKADNTVKDIDGNVYNTVKIGRQVWMVENLKTTHLDDGTEITIIIDDTEWNNLTTPGYCWYNNDEATYKSAYGALYNWYAVNTDNLCPTGWHVPSNTEWDILVHTLDRDAYDNRGESTIAGGKLKETGLTHWNSPNPATNESGFTALPGGRRGTGLGGFIEINSNGWWHTSTDSDSTHAYSRNIRDWNTNIYKMSGGSKQVGFSVRCIKD